MANTALAEALIATMAASSQTLLNPFVDRNADDTPCNGPAQRRARLAEHLDCVPRLILCGESPGYMGMRISGVPFTSERLLLQNAIPRVGPVSGRLSERLRAWSEPSATIVWRALYALHMADATILWNAQQLHPHRPGLPLTNRTPSDAELEAGRPALARLAAEFPKATWVAVGRKAEGLLADVGIASRPVRHPANGGATEFARGLAEIVRGLTRRTAHAA